MNDITTIVLDRPRHHDLIEEIRAAGARIKLIQDGDVTASISAAIRGTNDHLAIGIGGTRQAVLSAAALRCLGGELQAQLWPTTRGEIEAAPRARGRRREPRVLLRRSRARRGDRRRDGRLERRPPPRRPLPGRQRPHALARHVHALQLGALHRRDPLLRARAQEEVRLLGSESPGYTGRCRPRGDRRRAAHVEDPELGMDIVELGLFYDVEIDGPKVKVIHTLTSMGCPAGPMIQEDIQTRRRGRGRGRGRGRADLRPAVDAGQDVRRREVHPRFRLER